MHVAPRRTLDKYSFGMFRAVKQGLRDFLDAHETSNDMAIQSLRIKLGFMESHLLRLSNEKSRIFVCVETIPILMPPSLPHSPPREGGYTLLAEGGYLK